MFGIKEIKEDVNGLRLDVANVSNRASNFRTGVEAVLQIKNNEINALNRKVDTLLDYLGLKYSPEIVHIDCIEEIETDNQKGKK
jgi:hypothetical protein